MYQSLTSADCRALILPMIVCRDPRREGIRNLRGCHGSDHYHHTDPEAALALEWDALERRETALGVDEGRYGVFSLSYAHPSHIYRVPRHHLLLVRYPAAYSVCTLLTRITPLVSILMITYIVSVALGEIFEASQQ